MYPLDPLLALLDATEDSVAFMLSVGSVSVSETNVAKSCPWLMLEVVTYRLLFSSAQRFDNLTSDNLEVVLKSAVLLLVFSGKSLFLAKFRFILPSKA